MLAFSEFWLAYALEIKAGGVFLLGVSTNFDRADDALALENHRAIVAGSEFKRQEFACVLHTPADQGL